MLLLICLLVLLWWHFSCSRAFCGWLMQIQTEERGCFTLQGHSSVALHAVRFKAMRRNWSSDHQASPAMALWITHSDKRPRTQGHLHSTTTLCVLYICVVCVRMSGLALFPWNMDCIIQSCWILSQVDPCGALNKLFLLLLACACSHSHSPLLSHICR